MRFYLPPPMSECPIETYCQLAALVRLQDALDWLETRDIPNLDLFVQPEATQAQYIDNDAHAEAELREYWSDFTIERRYR